MRLLGEEAEEEGETEEFQSLQMRSLRERSNTWECLNVFRGAETSEDTTRKCDFPAIFPDLLQEIKNSHISTLSISRFLLFIFLSIFIFPT